MSDPSGAKPTRRDIAVGATSMGAMYGALEVLRAFGVITLPLDPHIATLKSDLAIERCENRNLDARHAWCWQRRTAESSGQPIPAPPEIERCGE